MSETLTVDVAKMEAALEKKLNDKEVVITRLQTELETIKASLAKGEMDKRDNEIKELKASLELVNKDLAISKESLVKKNDELKASVDQVAVIQTELKTKTENLEIVNKELNEVKAKQIVSSRISAYRTKSGDVASKDEDLVKKFGKLTDEAFATLMEFVSEVKPVEVTESLEDLAKKALEQKPTEETVVPPTSTQASVPNVNPLQAIAKKMIAEIYPEVK